MTNTEAMRAELTDIIHDLRGLHKAATPGEWGKGQTTHHTVSKRPGEKPYRIAEFHHAADASFCDFAHRFMPMLLDEIERLASRSSEDKGVPEGICRSQFETHMRKAAPTYTEEILLGRAASGKYSSLITEFCWQTWVASNNLWGRKIPEGWALVPITPTDEMRDAGNIHTLSRGALFAAWRAMLAAAPRATEAGTESAEQWLPISSAPKDGTVILGWIVAPEIDYSEAFAAPSLMRWQPGFKSSICNRADGWNKEWRGEPTHWMPLPAPPQSAPVDGGGAKS